MRLSIVAVGRLKAGPERVLFERYSERLGGIGRGVGLGPLDLTEFPESRADNPAQRRRQEAQKILDRRDPGFPLIALDERGRTMSSKAFTDMLRDRRDEGCVGLCFAIGGADGHGQEVRDASDLALALGPLTLPHGLARIVLAEQLYRASTMLAGHPYHRE